MKVTIILFVFSMAFYFDEVDRENNRNNRTQLPLYFGPPPQTFNFHISWFDDPTTWENHYQTRPFYFRDEQEPLRQWRLYEDWKHLVKNIERMVIDRCLIAPSKKENVGKSYYMYVGGRVDRELWEYFKLKNIIPPESSKNYRKRCPGHYGYEYVGYEKLEWGSRHGMPKFITPHWNYTKWINDYILYRAWVYNITLIWSEYTENLRVEFNYHTWYYNSFYRVNLNISNK